MVGRGALQFHRNGTHEYAAIEAAILVRGTQANVSRRAGTNG